MNYHLQERENLKGLSKTERSTGTKKLENKVTLGIGTCFFPMMLKQFFYPCTPIVGETQYNFYVGAVV